MPSLASRAYNSFRYSVNGNRQSFATNRLYRSYHRHCRKRAGELRTTEQNAADAEQFRRDGYLVFPAALPPALAANLKARVDEAFSLPANYVSTGKGSFRLFDGIERFPDVLAAFNDRVTGALAAFYGSHFKIFAAPFYRTVPNGEEDKSSFLWHVDNCPREEIKLMVYLDDVSEETGAFRLKPKPLSDRLIKNGFWDRTNIKRFEGTLADASSTVIFEQKAGDAILFMNWGCIHRAKSPARDHRDVANFVIIPSDIPWREHYSRNRHLLSTNAGICVDPYSDVPESVSYLL